MKKKTLLTVMAILANGLLAMHARTQSPEINQSDVEKELNEKIEFFNFGRFDTWLTRNIKESGIIGGKTKTLYEIAPNATWNNNNPYHGLGGSPGPRQTCWQRFLA